MSDRINVNVYGMEMMHASTCNQAQLEDGVVALVLGP